MVIKTFIASSAVAFAVSILAVHAESASLSAFNVTGMGASGIENAAQHCWRSHGSRHCHWYGYRGRYRETGNPNIYRYGSSNWWHEMDNEDRGGRF